MSRAPTESAVLEVIYAIEKDEIRRICRNNVLAYTLVC